MYWLIIYCCYTYYMARNLRNKLTGRPDFYHSILLKKRDSVIDQLSYEGLSQKDIAYILNVNISQISLSLKKTLK